MLRSDNSHVYGPGLLVADDDTAWVAVVPLDRRIIPVVPGVQLVQECLLRGLNWQVKLDERSAAHDWFSAPKPVPTTRIVNVLGDTLLEVPARDFVGSTCLRGKDLSRAVLRGQWLDGADLRDTNFLGADLRGTSFYRCDLRNACLAYALIEGARFDNADLEGADLLYTDIKRARFDGAMIGPTTTIPGIYACERREW